MALVLLKVFRSVDARFRSTESGKPGLNMVNARLLRTGAFLKYENMRFSLLFLHAHHTTKTLAVHSIFRNGSFLALSTTFA
jgi:hypothetical protein